MPVVRKPANSDGTEANGGVLTKRPTNELDQVRFQDPLMRVMQQELGPFIVHKPDCEGDPCTCGLTAALATLQQREMMIRRYGSGE
jgi:hypothetical protein